MATSKRIKVMLSSRCNVEFSDKEKTPMTEVRRALKEDIESQKLFGMKPFQVWINEDAEGLDHTADSWEACLKQVQDCDVLIVLYNGEAGWAKTGADIGICHAEYAEGLKHSPGKVRLLELPWRGQGKDADEKERNARFEAFRKAISAFRGKEILTIDDLKKEVQKTLFDAVLTQTRRGGEGAKAGRFDLGAALEWSRMDFTTRKRAMEAEMRASLLGRKGSSSKNDSLVIQVEQTPVLVRLHAIPASLSIAAARESIGRPHLGDHKLPDALKSAAGPLHMIACHRSVTETQATNLLGFPDAVVVSSSFGVYLVDEVHKTQFVFLANCRDDVQTRLATQRFFEWLDQASEAKALAQRAMARSRIVAAIAKEQSSKK